MAIELHTSKNPRMLILLQIVCVAGTHGRWWPGQPREAYYLLNRMNNARSLCRDVHAAMKEQLGGRLCPQLVHFDSAVEEALASQQPVTEYAPDGVAAKDFQALGAWVVEQL